jgi:hypothetical protein
VGGESLVVGALSRGGEEEEQQQHSPSQHEDQGGDQGGPGHRYEYIEYRVIHIVERELVVLGYDYAKVED